MALLTGDSPAGQAPTEARAPARPPAVRWPALAQTLAWAVAPTWAMDRWAPRYGEAYTIKFFPSGRTFTMVSAPEAVKDLFTAPGEVAPSAAGNSPIAGVMGPNSVLTLTGPAHLRQRRLLLPPFHGERMREYETVIVEATRADMASWPLGRPMRLQERTRAITFEVILRAVFGVEAERMDAMRRAIGELAAPMHTIEALRIALTRPRVGRPGGAIGEALDGVDRVLYEEIGRRRGQPDLEQRTDILSLLLLARDEQGQAMSDAELRDELVTLLLAGHETTATATAWAIERLVRDPQRLGRLVEEIDAGQSEEYMQAVIHETLRVRPVVPSVVRYLQAPLRVGEHELPAGSLVMASIYRTNRNPRVYERPAEFMPERFLGANPDTFAWIPFGGGIRRCIGASFAMFEMKLILRTVLSELSPRLPRSGARGERIRRRAVTLVPAKGARVVWERR